MGVLFILLRGKHNLGSASAIKKW